MADFKMFINSWLVCVNVIAAGWDLGGGGGEGGSGHSGINKKKVSSINILLQTH